MWGKKCKSLGSLKSFLSYASQLSGVSFLSFSHPPQAQQDSPWGVADGCWITDIDLPGCPLGSEIHIWRPGIADDSDIQFINVAENTSFLCVKHSDFIYIYTHTILYIYVYIYILYICIICNIIYIICNVK